ncbi:hypothetical protein CEUSTIGMA_g12947.t1 [Chlamydomonas eustigma]|uniref:Uncharacterized protein n=1 Tax=Chlamydomonas eustigma TaxID=1157962 RepID=A0A250XR26_9CHLO|nr:hypothetical protein CEUSTIGMA_g12947.t1 [Chlamydomonas eustigma]|eukprot:GAX85531.1 hypothetical protein CEUSTIGMA_g12947.t1 [Chlamydomonas eustigma]
MMFRINRFLIYLHGRQLEHGRDIQVRSNALAQVWLSTSQRHLQGFKKDIRKATIKEKAQQEHDASVVMSNVLRVLPAHPVHQVLQSSTASASKAENDAHEAQLSSGIAGSSPSAIASGTRNTSHDEASGSESRKLLLGIKEAGLTASQAAAAAVRTGASSSFGHSKAAGKQDYGSSETGEAVTGGGGGPGGLTPDQILHQKITEASSLQQLMEVLKTYRGDLSPENVAFLLLKGMTWSEDSSLVAARDSELSSRRSSSQQRHVDESRTIACASFTASSSSSVVRHQKQIMTSSAAGIKVVEQKQQGAAAAGQEVQRPPAAVASKEVQRPPALVSAYQHEYGSWFTDYFQPSSTPPKDATSSFRNNKKQSSALDAQLAQPRSSGTASAVVATGQLQLLEALFSDEKLMSSLVLAPTSIASKLLMRMSSHSSSSSHHHSDYRISKQNSGASGAVVVAEAGRRDCGSSRQYYHITADEAGDGAGTESEGAAAAAVSSSHHHITAGELVGDRAAATAAGTKSEGAAAVAAADSSSHHLLHLPAAVDIHHGSGAGESSCMSADGRPMPDGGEVISSGQDHDDAAVLSLASSGGCSRGTEEQPQSSTDKAKAAGISTSSISSSSFNDWLDIHGSRSGSTSKRRGQPLSEVVRQQNGGAGSAGDYNGDNGDHCDEDRVIRKPYIMSNKENLRKSFFCEDSLLQRSGGGCHQQRDNYNVAADEVVTAAADPLKRRRSASAVGSAAGRNFREDDSLALTCLWSKGLEPWTSLSIIACIGRGLQVLQQMPSCSADAASPSATSASGSPLRNNVDKQHDAAALHDPQLPGSGLAGRGLSFDARYLKQSQQDHEDPTSHQKIPAVELHDIRKISRMMRQSVENLLLPLLTEQQAAEVIADQMKAYAESKKQRFRNLSQQLDDGNVLLALQDILQHTMSPHLLSEAAFAVSELRLNNIDSLAVIPNKQLVQVWDFFAIALRHRAKELPTPLLISTMQVLTTNMNHAMSAERNLAMMVESPSATSSTSSTDSSSRAVGGMRGIGEISPPSLLGKEEDATQTISLVLQKLISLRQLERRGLTTDASLSKMPATKSSDLFTRIGTLYPNLSEVWAWFAEREQSSTADASASLSGDLGDDRHSLLSLHSRLRDDAANNSSRQTVANTSSRQQPRLVSFTSSSSKNSLDRETGRAALGSPASRHAQLFQMFQQELLFGQLLLLPEAGHSSYSSGCVPIHSFISEVTKPITATTAHERVVNIMTRRRQAETHLINVLRIVYGSGLNTYLLWQAMTEACTRVFLGSSSNSSGTTDSSVLPAESAPSWKSYEAAIIMAKMYPVFRHRQQQAYWNWASTEGRKHRKHDPSMEVLIADGKDDILYQGSKGSDDEQPKLIRISPEPTFNNFEDGSYYTERQRELRQVLISSISSKLNRVQRATSHNSLKYPKKTDDVVFRQQHLQELAKTISTDFLVAMNEKLREVSLFDLTRDALNEVNEDYYHNTAATAPRIFQASLLVAEATEALSSISRYYLDMTEQWNRVSQQILALSFKLFRQQHPSRVFRNYNTTALDTVLAAGCGVSDLPDLAALASILHKAEINRQYNAALVVMRPLNDHQTNQTLQQPFKKTASTTIPTTTTANITTTTTTTFSSGSNVAHHLPPAVAALAASVSSGNHTSSLQLQTAEGVEGAAARGWDPITQLCVLANRVLEAAVQNKAAFSSTTAASSMLMPLSTSLSSSGAAVNSSGDGVIPRPHASNPASSSGTSGSSSSLSSNSTLSSSSTGSTASARSTRSREGLSHYFWRYGDDDKAFIAQLMCQPCIIKGAGRPTDYGHDRVPSSILTPAATALLVTNTTGENNATTTTTSYYNHNCNRPLALGDIMGTLCRIMLSRGDQFVPTAVVQSWTEWLLVAEGGNNHHYGCDYGRSSNKTATIRSCSSRDDNDNSSALNNDSALLQQRLTVTGLSAVATEASIRDEHDGIHYGDGTINTSKYSSSRSSTASPSGPIYSHNSQQCFNPLHISNYNNGLMMSITAGDYDYRSYYSAPPATTTTSTLHPISDIAAAWALMGRANKINDFTLSPVFEHLYMRRKEIMCAKDALLVLKAMALSQASDALLVLKAMALSQAKTLVSMEDEIKRRQTQNLLDLLKHSHDSKCSSPAVKSVLPSRTINETPAAEKTAAAAASTGAETPSLLISNLRGTEAKDDDLHENQRAKAKGSEGDTGERSKERGEDEDEASHQNYSGLLDNLIQAMASHSELSLFEAASILRNDPSQKDEDEIEDKDKDEDEGCILGAPPAVSPAHASARRRYALSLLRLENAYPGSSEKVIKQAFLDKQPLDYMALTCLLECMFSEVYKVKDTRQYEVTLSIAPCSVNMDGKQPGAGRQKSEAALNVSLLGQQQQATTKNNAEEDEKMVSRPRLYQNLDVRIMTQLADACKLVPKDCVHILHGALFANPNPR